ncbi:DUF4238 domain-containing protein [Novosphingobium sp. JCM 18896]|uniref:DUF4238 domain-containing protein n=1 Tax=Novosphingobium sp. JCM 18896 TaxID=2989731 RepID=UPI002221F79C|nr:DUF4238 domain-containing protein [Novosphingobium sp. JCM 18896]MCW1432152.1 DUF4238 domain-containing protein [Novosphingobium sp. JCM 18896]
MTSSNPPAKHHYIPEFLLAQWAVNEGKLWRFLSSIPGKIVEKAVAPAEIGYEKYLYETPGLPPEQAQQIEQYFMSPLDSMAADAHKLLLAGKAHKMPQKERSAWSRFVMSLWFRTPAGLAYFKEAMGLILKARDEPLNARYDEVKQDGYPDTLEDVIAMLGPEFSEQIAMRLFRKMSDDPKNGLRLNNMQWFVLEAAGRPLLISDAALQHSQAPIFSHNGYITLPIAPEKLFVAVNQIAVAQAIDAIPRRDLVGQVNRAVVRRAAIFVGAPDRSQDTFIRDNFGKDENHTLIRGLAEKYRIDAGASA